MIEMTLEKKDVDGLFDRLKGLSPKQQAGVMFNGFKKAGIFLEAPLKANSGGGILKRRSGFLSNSIGSKVEQTDGNLQAVVGSGLRTGKRMGYANIHENGGTITGKPWLTIPLTGALKPSGAPAFSARALRNGFVSGYKSSFVMRGIIWGVTTSKMVSMLINGEKSKSRIVPLFMLKKSVDVPGRHYLSKTLAANEGSVLKIIVDSIKEALNK